ncbi:hypothetical protein KSD_43290 [Ktedonobacter sp. SOSP1-85]|nr:hypothetical protein KSD_43290 [Ktedonobacter sp. SOSP1-85]
MTYDLTPTQQLLEVLKQRTLIKHDMPFFLLSSSRCTTRELHTSAQGLASLMLLGKMTAKPFVCS